MNIHAFFENFRGKGKHQLPESKRDSATTEVKNVHENRAEQIQNIGGRIVQDLIRKGQIQREGSDLQADCVIQRRNVNKFLNYTIKLDDFLDPDGKGKRKVKISIQFTSSPPQGLQIETSLSGITLSAEAIHDFIAVYQKGDIIVKHMNDAGETVLEQFHPRSSIADVNRRMNDDQHSGSDENFARIMKILSDIANDLPNANSATRT